MPAFQFSQLTIREAATNSVFLETLSWYIPYCPCISREDFIQEVILQGLIAEDKENYKPEMGSPMRYLLGIAFYIRIREYKRTEYFRKYQLLSTPPEPVRQPLDQLILNELVGLVRHVVSEFSVDDARLLIESDDPKLSPRKPLTSTERARKRRRTQDIRDAISNCE